MKINYKLTLLSVLFFGLSFTATAQWKKEKANRETAQWRYDLECNGIAKKGSKLVKAWTYSKNPKHAISRGMKNAVHGIIFQGYAGGGQGCTPFQALITDPEVAENHAAFFEKFFEDGGEYQKYVSGATDGNIAPGDRLKVSRREYKIGVVVNVLSDALRARLEKEGIIRGLTTGF